MERDAPSAARAMGLQIQIVRVSANQEIDALRPLRLDRHSVPLGFGHCNKRRSGS